MYWQALLCLSATALSWLLFIPPPSLSHIPQVPIVPLILSYFARESEDKRNRRIIIPYANRNRYPIVLVWTFGIWIVHIIDHKVAQSAFKNPAYRKVLPPAASLLWRFVGTRSILFTNDDEWSAHSQAVHFALQRAVPVQAFCSVMTQYFETSVKEFQLVKWDEMSKRITLQILGVTVLGYDFQTFRDSDSPFVEGYRKVLKGLTSPLYMFIPQLDKFLPRRQLEQEMTDLRSFFRDIIHQKKANAREEEDVISCMLRSSNLTEEEILDNLIVLFIAGHDTTSAALSSIIYFLSKYPKYQSKARSEVEMALQGVTELSVATISRMPFVAACVKEAMRMNNPSNTTLPRHANIATQLGTYLVPPNCYVVFNIYAMFHVEAIWTGNELFKPERFIDNSSSLNQSLATCAFSVGPRACPARNFAMWELRTVVALLLHEFSWSLPLGSIHRDGVQNGFAFGTNVNQPQNLEIEFHKINRDVQRT